MEIKELIPKHVYDIEAVDKLCLLKPSELETIIPDLFEFLADPNWPIVHKIIPLLAGLGELIVPCVKNFLSSYDDQKQYTILYMLLPMLDNKVLNDIKVDVKRLAFQPIEYEMLTEMDVAAKHILEKYYVRE